MQLLQMCQWIAEGMILKNTQQYALKCESMLSVSCDSSKYAWYVCCAIASYVYRAVTNVCCEDA